MKTALSLQTSWYSKVPMTTSQLPRTYGLFQPICTMDGTPEFGNGAGTIADPKVQ
jgi:hypothetical protein